MHLSELFNRWDEMGEKKISNEIPDLGWPALSRFLPVTSLPGKKSLGRGPGRVQSIPSLPVGIRSIQYELKRLRAEI
jgi:hypothetical protein